MNKGDLITFYINGIIVTVCVLGTYHEDYSGEEMAILAVVNQENMVHVPVNDIEVFFPWKKYIN